jgi:hypothetical protein
MNKLSCERLSGLSKEARLSPRQRMNHNFHAELSDPIQRLAIAMEPGTYIRPHRPQPGVPLPGPDRGCIGLARKRQLLKNLGSLKRVKIATMAELVQVPGIGPELAAKI